MVSLRLQAALLGLALALDLGLAPTVAASIPDTQGIADDLLSRLSEPRPELDVSEPACVACDTPSLAETRVRGFRLFDPLSRPGYNGVSRGNAAGSTFGLWGIRVGPVQKGLWTDPVTGVAYARARWYDARNGVFLTEDPMGDVDSPNLYAFVGWGPSMYTDPMGLCFGGLKCRDLGTVWWEYTKANAVDVYDIGTGMLDFATLGIVSGTAEGVQTFSTTEGTVLERGQAAQDAMQRRQLAVISLGLSEADDKVDHGLELLGVNAIQRGGSMMGEGYAMGDADLFWRGFAETSGGVGNLSATFAGGAYATTKTVGAVRAVRIRQTVRANVAESVAARRASNFTQHVAREAKVPRETPSLSTRGFRPPPGTRVVPEGIPEGWRIVPSRRGSGVRYYEPQNPGNAVRVMPGNPNSPYPNSRTPYVRWQRNGQALDASGNVVPGDSAGAHIPLQDFRFNPDLF